MKVRDLLTLGAISTALVAGPTLAYAGSAAPLEAGGPAAQSGLTDCQVGTADESDDVPCLGLIEIGGLLFVVTAAGLVLFDDDDSGSLTPPTSTSTSTSASGT